MTTNMQEKIKDLSGPQLVNLYNLTAKELNRPEVKKFTDLATGRKRVVAILEDFEGYKQRVRNVVAIKKEAKQIEKSEQESKAPKNSGVGIFIKQMLTETSKTPAQIVEAVREKFPESKASARDVAWYKCKLLKQSKG